MTTNKLISKRMNKYMKKIVAAAMVAGFTFSSLSMSGCGNTPIQTVDPEPISVNPSASVITGEDMPEEEFINSSANFSVELFKNCVNSSEGNNVLISPESIMVALAMTGNGAGGETLTEFEQMLCGGAPIANYNNSLYKYNADLLSSKEVKFNMANSIWVNSLENANVKKDFIDLNKNYYNAEVYTRDFNDDTKNEINKWVYKNTDKKIEKVLDRITKDNVMFLINAVTFEGKWMNQYEESDVNENRIFTNADGKEEQVTMLNSKENIYICDEHMTGVIKDYKGGDYAFMALLPDEGVSVSDYVNELTGEKLIDIYENRTFEDVYTSIPEFTYDYDIELKDTLIGMGLESAFDNGDFSNMFDEGSYGISSVLHKAHIELDREGTKAAAVTVVTVDKATAVYEENEPKVVRLDRPFVYAIIETETGMPVFMGVVNTINN